MLRVRHPKPILSTLFDLGGGLFSLRYARLVVPSTKLWYVSILHTLTSTLESVFTSPRHILIGFEKFKDASSGFKKQKQLSESAAESQI